MVTRQGWHGDLTLRQVLECTDDAEEVRCLTHPPHAEESGHLGRTQVIWLFRWPGSLLLRSSH